MNRWTNAGIFALVAALLFSAWWNNQEIRNIGLRITPKLDLKVNGKMTVYRTTVYCHGQPIEVVTDCANYPDVHTCYQAFLEAVEEALANCERLQAVFDKYGYNPNNPGEFPKKK